MSADDKPTVALTLDEFLAIGAKTGELRGRIGWLEYHVEELLRANNALVERARAAEQRTSILEAERDDLAAFVSHVGALSDMVMGVPCQASEEGAQS